MSFLQLPDDISTDSSDLPSEIVKSVRTLIDCALGRHPSGPTGPEAFGDFE